MGGGERGGVRKEASLFRMMVDFDCGFRERTGEGKRKADTKS